ncbi:MAG: ABC transporter ATP-binding protein [Candidatus Carbobacillus altaicus]|nr:ABC transporter ATP-binding protein [Candidatus Carbobacillus altaicus]
MQIIVDHLKVSYGSQLVLKDMTFQIPNGSFLALLGPSGSGKSTLLNVLAGFLRPSAGAIYFGDKLVSSPDVILPPEKRKIGMVFQSFALWPHMTVEEHIVFPMREQARQKRRPWRAVREAFQAEVERILMLTGLTDLRNRYPHELSGGQKQRVSFARALATSNELILLDEPFSSLDVHLRDHLRQELKKIHRETRATIVFVTHDQAEAMALADHIAVLHNGFLEQIAPPDELFLRPQTPFVATFVGRAVLFPGRWEANRFYPEGWIGSQDGMGMNETFWEGRTVAQAFKRTNVFPIRPDEWMLCKHEPGIPVKIIVREYAGITVRFTVLRENARNSKDEPLSWNILSTPGVLYQEGETLYARPRFVHKGTMLTEDKC